MLNRGTHDFRMGGDSGVVVMIRWFLVDHNFARDIYLIGALKVVVNTYFFEGQLWKLLL